MSFVGYTCWTQSDALRLLANEALERNDALFLATHHPIEGFLVGGSRAAIVEERSEQGLLDALTRADNRHVFCVVEGEPGSGKSHLIRWLRIKWPDRDGKDLVLLIQRANGSLEGTLQSLRSELPDAYRSIFDGLGTAQPFTPEGRRENFQNKLATSMRGTNTTADLPDAAWCDQRGIAAVLKQERALELWGAPHRILQILSGQGTTSATRDQELARFTLRDVIDIGQMGRELRSLPFAATRWLRELKRETDVLQALLSTTTEAAVESRSNEFPESFGLLRALELRLNSAIQELLGSSARELDKLFRALRQRLHREGRRLVLLLEDVTNFQGVDEKLIDALVFNADTQTDDTCCDLISVLGVTPDYYRRYIGTKSNYAQRITQHVRLQSGSDADQGALHGAAVSFAGRYLRAVRAGQEHLTGFNGDGEVFNRCDECEHRGACHRIFGSNGGVGLYPFTERAISQMFSHLTDPNNAMTLQTPRGLIQNILNPTLHSPVALQNGLYPHSGLDTEFLPRRVLDGSVRAKIGMQPEPSREPLRRLLSWWGEPSLVVREGVDERGNMSYQEVPREIFEVFGLPWLGGDRVTPPPPPLATTPRTTSPPTTTPRTTSPPTTTPPTTTPPTTTPPTPTTRWELSQLQLATRQGQLSRWAEGAGALEDGPAFWNLWLHRLITLEVPWRRLGVSPWLQQSIFSQSHVMIVGTKQARDHYFVVDKTGWLRDGLEAFLTLQTRPLPVTDLEHHRYRLVRLVRKLEAEVKRHIQALLAPVQGQAWSPVGAVVQVGLARAWLRGTLRPEMNLVDQWAYLFETEPSAEASPKKRVESWSTLSARTATLPGALTTRLRLMVSQPQGVVSPELHGASELGLADPSEALVAMKDFLAGLTFSYSPHHDRVKWDEFLPLVLKMIGDMQDLPQVPRREGRRLLDVARELEHQTPGESLQEFARRVQEIVTQLAGVLPSAPNDAIQGWTVRYKDEAQRGILAAGAEARVEKLDDFKADQHQRSLESFVSPAALLDWCILAPADDLQSAKELVAQADVSLRRLMDHARDILSDASAAEGVSLEQLRAEGAVLKATCSTLLSLIREEP
jgi:hypothetical protein